MNVKVSTIQDWNFDGRLDAMGHVRRPATVTPARTTLDLGDHVCRFTWTPRHSEGIGLFDWKRLIVFAPAPRRIEDMHFRIMAPSVEDNYRGWPHWLKVGGTVLERNQRLTPFVLRDMSRELDQEETFYPFATAETGELICDTPNIIPINFPYNPHIFRTSFFFSSQLI